MKHRRSGHYKVKAARGAYSDRHGPRPPRRTAAGVASATSADPWVREWPVRGLTAVTPLPGGSPIRRP